MSDLNKPVVVDVTLLWAAVQKPRKDSGKYQTDMIPLNTTEEQKLIDAGLKPARRETGELVSYADIGFPGTVYRAKRSTTKKDGTVKVPPIVTDSQNNTLTSYLGNGTKARVHMTVYDYNAAGRKGRTADMFRVQVIDLVEFTPAVPTIQGGYVVGSTQHTEDNVDSTDPEVLF